MNSLADDIKNILVDDGVLDGTPSNRWGANIGDLPSSPDKCVMFEDSPGANPIYLMDGTAIYQPKTQATIRSDTYISSYSKCQEIIKSLEMRNLNEDIDSSNNSVYWMIKQVSPISYFGRDEKGRFLFVTSFQVQRHEEGD